MRPVLAALLACIALTGTAHAELEPERYPVSIVLVDVAATAAVVGGGYYVIVESQREGEFSGEPNETPGRVLVGLGLTMYALGPSLVHLVHDNPRGAIRSSVARFALPIVAGYASYALSNDPDSTSVGFIAGVGAAMIADWAFFAKAPGVQLVAAPAATGGTVGLAGRF
jgi:hypothetical protein